MWFQIIFESEHFIKKKKEKKKKGEGKTKGGSFDSSKKAALGS